jgi:DNA-binding response OmpR family regulator
MLAGVGNTSPQKLDGAFDVVVRIARGAVVCMAKPFKPERLLHVVRLVAPPPTARSAYGAELVAG